MISFVTGTGTGVGKTIAAAVLVRAEVAAGRRAVYYKAVQTGVGPTEGGDAGFVAVAVPGAAVHEGLRFPAPLAPAVAAALAGAAVDVDGLVAAIHAAAVDEQADAVVVEGAGGLLVPVTDGVTMADLAARLGARLVVVTRPSLGTLNHTALTVEAARARGLDVAGLVVSGWPAEPGVTERTNLERLEAMAPVLGLVPHIAGLDVEDPETLTPARAASLRLL